MLDASQLIMIGDIRPRNGSRFAMKKKAVLKRLQEAIHL